MSGEINPFGAEVPDGEPLTDEELDALEADVFQPPLGQGSNDEGVVDVARVFDPEDGEAPDMIIHPKQ